jgi:Oxidoreductase family, NAD-binding Rossmann fold
VDKAIGLVGIGKISQVQVAALSDIPAVDVIGGCDPDSGKTLTFRDERRPVYTSLDELLTSRPSALIVATPTPTHYEICSKVLASGNRPSQIIIEKPIATSVAEVDDVLSVRSGIEAIGLYHASHAPEVVWAGANIEEWRKRFGDIVSYEASFADPYSVSDRQATSGLVNSWIDSGINALSVGLRFVRLSSVDRLTAEDALQRSFEASLRFTEGGREAGGTIRTDWNVSEPAKHTELGFADGTRLYLNHQAVSGELTSAGMVLDEFRYSGERPRLVAHYFNAFTSLFVDGCGYYSAEQSRHLHQLLLSTKAQVAE